MMNARCIHGFLKRHVMVDHIGDGLQYGRNNARTTGRPDHHIDLPFIGHNGGSHRRQRTLIRRDGIAVPLHQPIRVLLTDFNGKVIHLIVQQKTCSRRDDARAETPVDSKCRGYGIACFIHDGIVRGFGTLRQIGWRTDISRGCGTIGDGCPQRGGIVFIEKMADRIINEVGIAQIGVAVSVSTAQRLSHHMKRRCAVKTAFGQVIAFHDVQGLAQRGTS